MNWITKIESGFKKVEQFFGNLNFIAKLSKGLSVGMKACNDVMFNRNTEQLDKYLAERKDE